MQHEDFFLCSELVRVSAGRTAAIGNLEEISPDGCVVTLDGPVSAGTKVRMRCVECPQGKRNCTECRFRGTVQDQQPVSPLGWVTRIEIEGRMWSEEEWRPRHLTNPKLLKVAKRGAGA
jgi:hypothetical protein